MKNKSINVIEHVELKGLNKKKILGVNCALLLNRVSDESQKEDFLTSSKWCPQRDLNSQDRGRQILNLLCLPISPQGHLSNCMIKNFNKLSTRINCYTEVI